MDWSLIKADFEWDGSLRDIYILDATQADWDRVIDVLRQRDPSPVFRLADAIGPIPQQFPSFELMRDQGALLKVNVEGMAIHCHFFGPEEIEFDLDPREVAGPYEASALERFMGDLGRATGKDVILTPENGRTEVICRWSPETGKATWTSLS